MLTQDNILHMRSTLDGILLSQVMMNLVKPTAVYFENPYQICAGDSQGRIEMVSLKHLSLERMSSFTLEYHRGPIDYLSLTPKEGIGHGYWIASSSNGSLALWDSTAYFKPISVCYVANNPGSTLVTLNKQRSC